MQLSRQHLVPPSHTLTPKALFVNYRASRSKHVVKQLVKFYRDCQIRKRIRPRPRRTSGRSPPQKYFDGFGGTKKIVFGQVDPPKKLGEKFSQPPPKKNLKPKEKNSFSRLINRRYSAHLFDAFVWALGGTLLQKRKQV